MFELWCALAFQTALFEDVVVRLMAKMPIDFSLFFSYFHRKENNGAHFPVRKDKGESEQFKICINIDLNLVPEINMCKGGKEKQLSGGNQKWSMKLMKQQCHRLIQLSFQFPWQSSVIVPTIFSAGEGKKENMGGREGWTVKLFPIYSRISYIRVEHVQ